jgi:hypothetical protein
MVNATDMIKAFPNKRMSDFSNSQQTKDFIDALEKKLNTGNPVFKSKPGRYGGTWMHKLLAYKFAAWLNPEFEIFVYSVFDKFIKERLESQQRQLDYFWDKEDQIDLYRRKK